MGYISAPYQLIRGVLIGFWHDLWNTYIFQTEGMENYYILNKTCYFLTLNTLQTDGVGDDSITHLYLQHKMQTCRPNNRFPATFREKDQWGVTLDCKLPTCNIFKYCKRGNICGTLIFANFEQNSASANSKTRENISDILYAHLGHTCRSCVLTMCVDANG